VSPWLEEFREDMANKSKDGYTVLIKQKKLPLSLLAGRGLHSSTFRLNISTFCGIHWVHDFPPV